MVDVNFTIVVQAINFIILVFILKKVFWEPLMRHLDTRDRLILSRKQKTEELKEKTSEMMDEYRQKIFAARKQAVSEIDELVTEGSSERTRLIDEAMVKSESIVAEGEKKVRAELDQALSTIGDDEVKNMAEMIVKQLTASALRN